MGFILFLLFLQFSPILYLPFLSGAMAFLYTLIIIIYLFAEELPQLQDMDLTDDYECGLPKKQFGKLREPS